MTPDEPIAQELQAAPPVAATPPPVAPVWHTAIFIVVIIGFAALSARSQGEMIAKHGRVDTYLMTMGWEYLLVGYVIWGVHKKGVTLRELIGGKWNSIGGFLVDVALAFGFWMVALGVLAGLSVALGLLSASQVEEAKKQLGPLLPKTGLEMGLWVALSATAGFCEEVLFRGYLQQQFRAMTRSSAAALVLQAIMFGLAHLYQGSRRVVLIAVYGAMFGVLALWRKSLRPGMIGHLMQDSFSGIASRLLK